MRIHIHLEQELVEELDDAVKKLRGIVATELEVPVDRPPCLDVVERAHEKGWDVLVDAAALRRPRIGYRDVASATNKLTLIAAMLPAETVSTHTVFVLKTPLDDESQWCLLGLMNSLVANYLIRLRVTTHVTAATMARLPVPRPAAGSPAFDTLVALSRNLAVKGVDDAEREYVTVNALAAQLYGLSHDQFAYVLNTFPLVAAQVRDRCLTIF